MRANEVQAIFLVAGFENNSFHRIMNEYILRASETEPWWLVQTEFGLIKIGWRKRVISIDWSLTEIKVPEITTDDVTKDKHMVHAYSTVKAAEYLSTFREYAKNALIHEFRSEFEVKVELKHPTPGYIVNRVMGSIDWNGLVEQEVAKEPALNGNTK